jgi:hypothetical protein
VTIKGRDARVTIGGEPVSQATFETLDRWRETKASWYTPAKHRPDATAHVRDGRHPSGRPLGDPERICGDCGYLTVSGTRRCTLIGAIGRSPGNTVLAWRACDAFIDTVPPAEGIRVATAWAGRVGLLNAQVQLDHLMEFGVRLHDQPLYFARLAQDWYSPLLEPPPREYGDKPLRTFSMHEPIDVRFKGAAVSSVPRYVWRYAVVIRVAVQDVQAALRRLEALSDD